MLAAIALGSNLPSRFGDPDANLHEALRRLRTVGTVVAVSSFLETDPVGLREQPRFTNAAVLLETPLHALPLLHALLGIERSMGRLRASDLPPKGPRIVDLDLLLLEDDQGCSQVLRTPELSLPHPEMPARHFVLAPLAEIAPTMTVPPDYMTVATLLAQLSETTLQGSSG